MRERERGEEIQVYVLWASRSFVMIRDLTSLDKREKEREKECTLSVPVERERNSRPENCAQPTPECAEPVVLYLFLSLSLLYNNHSGRGASCVGVCIFHSFYAISYSAVVCVVCTFPLLTPPGVYYSLSLGWLICYTATYTILLLPFPPTGVNLGGLRGKKIKKKRHLLFGGIYDVPFP